MKKKLIAILVLMMLFCTIIPVIQSSSVEDNNETLGPKYFAFIFVRGKIKNVKEEIHNGTLWYNCSIVNVKMFQFVCMRPLKISFYIDNIIDFCIPLWLPKDTFIGIIQEGLIFGIAFMRGY